MRNSHLLIDGQFVSARIEQVVAAIKDYDCNLEVKWLPPSARTDERQAAFVVSYEPPGQEPYILFHVKTEEEFDNRVLQRIIVNDQRNGQTATLSEYEAWEETQKRLAKVEYYDQLEEAHDIAAHVVKSPLNTYRVSKDMIIKSDTPFNAAPNR